MCTASKKRRKSSYLIYFYFFLHKISWDSFFTLVLRSARQKRLQGPMMFICLSIKQPISAAFSGRIWVNMCAVMGTESETVMVRRYHAENAYTIAHFCANNSMRYHIERKTFFRLINSRGEAHEWEKERQRETWHGKHIKFDNTQKVLEPISLRFIRRKVIRSFFVSENKQKLWKSKTKTSVINQIQFTLTRFNN